MKNTTKNILFILLYQLLAIIMGFVIPKLTIQIFGSEVNGLIVTITQLLSYIIILEFGIGPVIKHALYKPIFQNNNSEIGSIICYSQRFHKKIAIGLILYVFILCIILPLIITQFNPVYIVTMVVILAFNIFVDYWYGGTARIYLEAISKVYVINIIQIISAIFILISFIISIKLSMSIHFIRLLMGLLLSIRPITIWIYARKSLKYCVQDVENSIFVSKWDGACQHIAYIIHMNTDVALLAMFISLSTVSVYSVYMLVFSGLRGIYIYLLNSLESYFGNLIVSNRERFITRYIDFENAFFAIIIIIFSCTYLLLIPFVQVYTEAITGINYTLPTFAFVITTAELLWYFRLLNTTLIKVSGSFAKTKKISVIEVCINIVVSLLFIQSHGILGVGIGTLCSMLYVLISYGIYVNKNILKRSSVKYFSKIIWVILQIILVTNISNLFISNLQDSYLSLGVSSVKIIVVACAVILMFHFRYIKNLWKRKINN